MITRSYFFPPRLMVLVGLKRSIWINSSVLEVDTIFLYINEFLVYFFSWHASQILSSSMLKLEIPLTKPLLINLDIR